MTSRDHDFIPALKYHRLTTFYDTVLRYATRETAFKSALVQQATIGAGERILDLGCGTATLTLLIKARHPQANVVGVDGDRQALEIGRAKAAKACVDVTLNEGLSFALPYSEHSFDKILASLFFHHLTRENKERTLREIQRVLKPDGELHVADWGKPRNVVLRLSFLLVQLLDGFEVTSDHVQGRLPTLFRNSGFDSVVETTHFATVFGTLSLYMARKSGQRIGKAER